MTKFEYTVRFEGEIVGTRKSNREYSHAIVARHKGNGTLTVEGFNGRTDLAITARDKYRSDANKYGSPYTFHAVEVERREIKSRKTLQAPCPGSGCHYPIGAVAGASYNDAGWTERGSIECAFCEKQVRVTGHGHTRQWVKAFKHRTATASPVEASSYTYDNKAGGHSQSPWFYAVKLRDGTFAGKFHTRQICEEYALEIHNGGEIRLNADLCCPACGGSPDHIKCTGWFDAKGPCAKRVK